jgi:hypothetical protein
LIRSLDCFDDDSSKNITGSTSIKHAQIRYSPNLISQFKDRFIRIVCSVNVSSRRGFL